MQLSDLGFEGTAVTRNISRYQQSFVLVENSKTWAQFLNVPASRLFVCVIETFEYDIDFTCFYHATQFCLR